MTTLTSFVDRLNKIGISVGIVSNFPWLYLDKVNELQVWQRYNANHGYNIAWYKETETCIDVPLHHLFNTIRDVLRSAIIYERKDYKKIIYKECEPTHKRILRKRQTFRIGDLVESGGRDDRAHISSIRESKTKKTLYISIKWY